MRLPCMKTNCSTIATSTVGISVRCVFLLMFPFATLLLCMFLFRCTFFYLAVDVLIFPCIAPQNLFQQTTELDIPITLENKLCAFSNLEGWNPRALRYLTRLAFLVKFPHFITTVPSTTKITWLSMSYHDFQYHKSMCLAPIKTSLNENKLHNYSNMHDWNVTVAIAWVRYNKQQNLTHLSPCYVGPPTLRVRIWGHCVVWLRRRFCFAVADSSSLL